MNYREVIKRVKGKKRVYEYKSWVEVKPLKGIRKISKSGKSYLSYYNRREERHD